MKQLGPAPNAHCVFKQFGKRDSGTLCFPAHYLAYSAQGSMRLKVESRYIFLQPSKAAWIPANTEVIAEISSSITCCSILFNPAHFPEHEQQVQTIDMSPLTRHMILHCQRWTYETAPKDENAQGFFSTLAAVLVERMASPTNDWIPRGKTELVSRAIDLTLERHSTSLGLATIASELDTSERTLSRRVVEETGLKWANLLRRIRIIQARELLAMSELPVTDVAAEVGYTSQSAFNRAFKEESDFTPREYRSFCKAI